VIIISVSAVVLYPRPVIAVLAAVEPPNIDCV